MKTLSLAGLMLALAGPLRAEGAPDWVNKGSRVENGRILAVGIGASHVDALANALGEMAAQLKSLRAAGKPEAGAEEQRVTSRIENLAEASFGPVLVSRRVLDAMEMVKGQSGAQTVTSDVRVVMKSGEKRLLIGLKLKSVTGADMSSSQESNDLELRGKDLQLTDLVKELKKQGMEMRRYQESDDSEEFLELGLKAPQDISPAVLEKIGKEEKSR